MTAIVAFKTIENKLFIAADNMLVDTSSFKILTTEYNKIVEVLIDDYPTHKKHSIAFATSGYSIETNEFDAILSNSIQELFLKHSRDAVSKGYFAKEISKIIHNIYKNGEYDSIDGLLIEPFSNQIIQFFNDGTVLQFDNESSVKACGIGSEFISGYFEVYDNEISEEDISVLLPKLFLKLNIHFNSISSSFSCIGVQ